MTRIPTITFARLTRSQQVLVLFGVLTAASAVVHGLVWLIAGMPSLAGPVSWRKPIVFGASIAVLSWSLTWVVGHLPETRALRHQTWWVVGLLTAELLLIDMQQWRGVASHFNNATPLDAAVFGAMGALIMAVAALLVWWTWRLFRAPRRDLPREQLTAARAGMLLLAAANGIGIGLSVWGSSLVAGAGGDLAALQAIAGLKLTHAIALHGLQVLPLASIALTYVASETARLSAMRRATAGYVLVLLWALWQAGAGRTPDEIAWPSAVLLVAGVLLGVWTVGLAAGAAVAAGMRERTPAHGVDR
jgi:hypothetical protein